MRKSYGSEKIRKNVLKKPFTNKRVVEVSKLLKKHDINFVMYWMFGLPFETKLDAMETVNLARETNANGMDCFLFKPYRGLDITTLAVENNFITEQDIKNLEQSHFANMNSVMRMKDICSIENIFYLFRLFVFFPKMEKLLLKLIEFKPNAFYRFIHFIFYASEIRKLPFGFKRNLIEIFYHKDE